MVGRQTTEPVSLSALESHLWEAANILRGPVDASDFKSFIFPLLFFKRVSDVYDEEYQEALTASRGDIAYAQFAENHRFQIPQDCHWNDIRATTTNVGQGIQRSLREIEKANPNTLYGIFGDTPWSNKDRLSDALLRDLIEHFSQISLANQDIGDDVLGQAYEYLIKKFADDSGHSAAEFYTNRTLVHLMTLMLDPRPVESVYDPTCGSGGMLLSCVSELKRRGKEYRTLRLYGQELNLMTSSIARMNMFLHGIEDFKVVRGDTLAAPAFTEGDSLRQFDVVLANPPVFHQTMGPLGLVVRPVWPQFPGHAAARPGGHAFFGHILASLKPKSGRCAILFPHGVLFRDEEQAMRAKLVDLDQIECVLGLGPNLFYNSPMEACVVVCRAAKPKDRRGLILFINAVNEVTRERAQSLLEEEHIQKVLKAYQAFQDIPEFARAVPVDEIKANQSSLNLALYVRPKGNGPGATAASTKSLATVIQEWQESSKALRCSMDSLLQELKPSAARGKPNILNPRG